MELDFLNTPKENYLKVIPEEGLKIAKLDLSGGNSEWSDLGNLEFSGEPSRMDTDLEPPKISKGVVNEPDFQTAEIKAQDLNKKAAMARRELALKAIENVRFKKNIPEIYEKNRVFIGAQMKKAEERMMSAPPVRASLMNSGSLGEVILAGVFNVASGGTYLPALKEAWARARTERNDAISEYMKLSQLYQNNEIAEQQFLMDGLNVQKSMIELDMATDPQNQEIKAAKLQQVQLELDETTQKVALMKQAEIDNEANRETKREEERLNLDLKRAELANKKAQTRERNFKIQMARKQASGLIADRSKQIEMEKRKNIDKILSDPAAKVNKDIYTADPKNARKVATDVSTLKSVNVSHKKAMEAINQFEKMKISPAKGLGKGLVAKGKEFLGVDSKKDKAFLENERKMKTRINSFFAYAKEILGLDRLSDKDVLIVKEFLNAEDTSSFYTPSKREAMKEAINKILSETKEKVFNQSQAINPKTGETYSRDELFQVVLGSKEKKVKPAPVKKKPSGRKKFGTGQKQDLYQYMQGLGQ